MITTATLSTRRRPRSWQYGQAASLFLISIAVARPILIDGFAPTSRTSFGVAPGVVTKRKSAVGSVSSSGSSSSSRTLRHPPSLSSSTALKVWWFGGTDDNEVMDEGADSCELVAVRIERPSANSRRIFGEIIVEAPLEDCWAILTDYNRLSTHVPNLVESKIVSTRSGGFQGDGSYQCRLYQKGAQKIVGFEFGADVTMDMSEKIVAFPGSGSGSVSVPRLPQERKIDFRCVDSFFFRAFDGEWNVKEIVDEDGVPIHTVLSYTVIVKPRGPVPVAALEWRIREDVPTNLRAVKKAATTVGEAGVLAAREKSRGRGRRFGKGLASSSTRQQQRKIAVREQVRELVGRGASKLAPVRVKWADDETLSKYLK